MYTIARNTNSTLRSTEYFNGVIYKLGVPQILWSNLQGTFFLSEREAIVLLHNINENIGSTNAEVIKIC